MEGAAENSGRATTGEDGSGAVVGTMTGVEGVARGTEDLTTGEGGKVLAGMEGRTTGDEGMMTGEEGRITVEAGGNVTCLIGLPGLEVTTVTTLAAWTASSTVSLNLLSMVSFSFNLFGSSGVNSFEVLILALLRLRDFSLRLLIVESTLVVV